jgi:predicted PurR-regulated permease PerM
MFDTSEDILNIAKTVAVIGLSVITFIFIYYLVRIIRELFKIIEEMRERINKIDSLIQSVKDKIEHSTSYLLLISEGMKKVIEIAKGYSEKDRKKKKEK